MSSDGMGDLSFVMLGIIHPIIHECPCHIITCVTKERRRSSPCKDKQRNPNPEMTYRPPILSPPSPFSSRPLPLVCVCAMALCRNRLSEERKLWRKDHPYVCPIFPTE